MCWVVVCCSSSSLGVSVGQTEVLQMMLPSFEYGKIQSCVLVFRNKREWAVYFFLF